MSYKDDDIRRSGDEGEGDLLEGSADEALDGSEDEDETAGGGMEEEAERWE